MKAYIITIGDEILIGQINDTNSGWIASQLNLLGISVVNFTSVSDNREEILYWLGVAEKRADLIVITGGLGPTKDDITKSTICEYFNCELMFSETAYSDVEHVFKSRGREVTELNRQQAMIPKVANVLNNKWGTAPGMWIEKNNKVFISLPGVPYEMKNIMETTALPKIREFFKAPCIEHFTVNTIGIGESFLSEKIADWEDALPSHIKLAYLPSSGMVRLRLSAYGPDSNSLKSDIHAHLEKLKPQIDEFIFGYENDTLPSVVGDLLKSGGLTMSIAESCTAGLIGHLITTVPGSSAYFLGGAVVYSNELKQSLLKVSPKTLENAGAVSEQTVTEMAMGVKSLTGSEYSVAVSGIAGPAGGTPDKPVGTVWVAIGGREKVYTRKFQLGTDRIINLQVSANYALNELRKVLLVELKHQ